MFHTHSIFRTMDSVYALWLVVYSVVLKMLLIHSCWINLLCLFWTGWLGIFVPVDLHTSSERHCVSLCLFLFGYLSSKTSSPLLTIKSCFLLKMYGSEKNTYKLDMKLPKYQIINLLFQFILVDWGHFVKHYKLSKHSSNIQCN